MRAARTAISLGLIAMFGCVRVQSAEPGTTAPLEWIDPDTGHRVIRLSTEPGTRSLYFHQNSITPDGRFVIAESNAGIVAIEIASRKNVLIVPGKARALFVGRKSGLVYFSKSDGAGDSEQRTATTIFTVPASGGRPKQIARIERGFIGSINADETLLLGVYAERAYQLEQGPRDPRFDANYAATGKDGKPLSFAEA
jgi:oligogalacturonide lyase